MYFDDNQEYNEDTYRQSGKKCIPQETVIHNVMLANAYVPFQKFCDICPPAESLRKGTIFPELYSPYEGYKKKKIIARKNSEENYEYGL